MDEPVSLSSYSMNLTRNFLFQRNIFFFLVLTIITLRWRKICWANILHLLQLCGSSSRTTVVNISNVRSNGVYSESFVLWQWPGKVCFQKSMKKSPKTFEEQNKSFKVTWLRPLFSHEKKNCTWEYFYLSLHHSVTFVFIFLSPEEWKWATHFTSKIDLPQNAVDLQFWWNWTQPSSGI